MVTRLMAKDAASMTSRRRSELDGEKIDVAKLNRQFRMQARQILKAAAGGATHLDFRKRLVKVTELIDRGLRVSLVDKAGQLEFEEVLLIKEQEEEQQKAIELLGLEEEVKRNIVLFIAEIETEKRFQRLPNSKRKVVKSFLEKIEYYKVNIIAGTCISNALFYELFDSSLVVFIPIERLSPFVQALQLSLHALERVRRDLPDTYDEGDFDDEESEASVGESKYDLSDIYAEFSREVVEVEEVDREIEFDRQLASGECSTVIEVDRAPNFFRVDWRASNCDSAASVDDLISSSFLAWLSGNLGQNFLSAVDLEMKVAIDKGESVIRLSFLVSSNLWECDLMRRKFVNLPMPLQIAEVLKLSGFKTTLEETNSQKVILTAVW